MWEGECLGGKQACGGVLRGYYFPRIGEVSRSIRVTHQWLLYQDPTLWAEGEGTGLRSSQAHCPWVGGEVEPATSREDPLEQISVTHFTSVGP